MKNEMQLELVELIFTYHKPSGEEVKIKGQIDGSVGWQQWGATKDELANNVEVIEAVNEAINQFLVEE